jgi:xylulokinase
MSLHIGIDLGTSGIKAVILQDATVVRAVTSVPLHVSIPHVGWSEQDPGHWVSAVFACLDQLAADHAADMAAVTGIGLSGQMLAALLLDRDLKPLRPAMLWNDQRATAECADLLALVPDIGLRTNGTPDPGITAPKLLWLARHEPRVIDAARMLLLTKDYVRLALTGELASDPTDAGGTQLLDCATGVWDAAICAAVGWSPDHLPPLLDAWQVAGTLRPALAQRWGMRRDVRIATGCGDNMGSTLGVGAARPGDAVLSIGTSGVACLVDDAFHPGPDHAILTSAHAAPGTFLSMGVVMSATATLDWAARITGTEAGPLAAEAEGFANAGNIADAPVFLPALTGVRTPRNRPQARGVVTGLHPGVTRAGLGYAAMEGVAFQMADCVAAQRAVGVRPLRFMAVGGGTRSILWVRLLATALGQPIDLPEGADLSGPRGAARLAAVATGADIGLLSQALPVQRQIEPDPALTPLLEARRNAFQALYP